MKFEPGNSAHKKKYETPADLQAAVYNYFLKMDAEERPYSVQGLAYELGFCETDSLLIYQSAEGYEDYHEIIKRAKLRIETDKAESLSDKSKSTIGIIFDLKYNHSWEDKKQITHNFNGSEVDLSKLPPEVLKKILESQNEIKS